MTLTRKSKACSYLEGGAPFAVNVLGQGQVDTAWHFAGRPAEPEPEWLEREATPYLVGSSAVYFCRPWRTYDGGDHLIVVGEVEHLDVADDEPLLFYRGAFREIGAIETGVHWGGSLDNPPDAGWFDARSASPPRWVHTRADRPSPPLPPSQRRLRDDDSRGPLRAGHSCRDHRTDDRRRVHRLDPGRS